MERCELEIGTAAHKARQFLEHFEAGAKHSSAVGAGTRGDRCAGSARKRARDCVGNGGGGGGGGQAKATDAALPRNARRCDETLEKALRLLLSGADTLAAWRLDSAAKDKSRAARLNHVGKSGQARAAGTTASAAEVDHAEEEVPSERRSHGARERLGWASGKRRRSRGARVRSRNAVIDGWLEEGGEEGGSREDAFVDLEDFIEA